MHNINDRKEIIINTALKVFCEKGYENTTVDDIAKKANMSHGLMYHYFKNKKEIFDQVMLANRNQNIEQTLSSFDDTYTNKDKLYKLTQRFFSDIIDNENSAYYFYLFVSCCFSHRDNEIKKKLDDKHNPFKLVETLFSEGQKNNEFTNKYSALECTKLYFSIIHGATLSYVIAPKEFRSNVTLPNIDFILEIFNKE